MTKYNLDKELQLRAILFEDDEYTEYDEQVIDRDEYYDPPEGEYPEEEYYDDGQEQQYDDEYYDDGSYDQAPAEYDEQYDYVDPMQNVLNELTELKQKISGQNPYYPQSTAPYVYTNNAAQANNDAVLYNEIARLRDEINRTQSAQAMHIEITKLKEEMAREAKQTENQLLSEIKRLTEMVNEQSKNEEGPHRELDDDDEYYDSHEGLSQSNEKGIGAEEFNKLIAINEQILKSSIGGDNKILAELERMKAEFSSISQQEPVPIAPSNTGEYIAILNQLYNIKNEIAAGGVSNVGQAVGSVSNNSELAHLLFELKQSIGSLSSEENKRVQDGLELYKEFESLRADVLSTNIDCGTKLKQIYEFQLKFKQVPENHLNDIAREFLSLRDKFANEIVDEQNFQAILEFNQANGRRFLSLSKEQLINDFFFQARNIGKNLDDLPIDQVQAVVDIKNSLQNNSMTSYNQELFNQIMGYNADIITASNSDELNAARAELNGCIKALATLTVGDVMEFLPLTRAKLQHYRAGEAILDLILEIKDELSLLTSATLAQDEAVAQPSAGMSEQDNAAALAQIDEIRSMLEEGLKNQLDSLQQDVANQLNEIRADNLDSIQKLLEITELSHAILQNVENISAYGLQQYDNVQPLETEEEHENQDGAYMDIARLRNEIISYIRASEEKYVQSVVSAQQPLLDEIKLENDRIIEEIHASAPQIDTAALMDEIRLENERLLSDLRADSEQASAANEQNIDLVAFLDEIKLENAQLSQENKQDNIALIDEFKLENISLVDTIREDNAKLIGDVREESAYVLENVNHGNAAVIDSIKEQLAQHSDEIKIENITLGEEIKSTNNTFIEELRDTNQQVIDYLRQENQGVVEDIRREYLDSLEINHHDYESVVASIKDENALAIDALKHENAAALELFRAENSELINMIRADDIIALDGFKAENAAIIDEIRAENSQGIERIVNENSFFHEQILADAQGSLDRLNEESAKNLEVIVETIRTENSDILAQVSTLNQQVLDEIKNEAQFSLEQFKIEGADQITQANTLNQLVLDEIKSQAQASLELLKNENAESITQANTLNQLVLDEIKNEAQISFEQIKQENSQNLEDIKSESASIIEAVRAENQSIVEEFKSITHTDTEAIQTSFNELRVDNLTAFDEFKNELTAVNMWVDSLREDFSGVKDSFDSVKSIENDIAINVENLASNSNLIASDISALRQSIEAQNVEEIRQNIESFKEDLAYIREQVSPIIEEVDDEEDFEQVVTDKLDEIRQSVATSDTQYDILADLAALKDSLSAFQFEDGFDLMTEVENIKSELAALREAGNLEVLSEIQVIHDDINGYQKLINEQLHRDNEASNNPQLLDEITAIREELNSLRDDFAEKFSLASTNSLDSDMITSEITALRDDFVTFKDSLDAEHPSEEDTIVFEQEFIERHTRILDEIAALKEEVGAVKDNLNKRAQAADVADGNISDDYSLVLGEIVALKNEVLEFKDEIRQKVDEADNAVVLDRVDELNKNLDASREAEEGRVQKLEEIAKVNESVASLITFIKDDFYELKDRIDANEAQAESKESAIEQSLNSISEEIVILKEQSNTAEILNQLREEIASIKEEKAQPQAVAVDNLELIELLNAMRQEISELKEQKEAQESTQITEVVELIRAEMGSMREEINALKEQMPKRMAMADGAAPSEDYREDYGVVLGEIIALREQIQANKADIEAALTTAPVSDSSQELKNIQHELESLRLDVAMMGAVPLEGAATTDLAPIQREILQLREQLVLNQVMAESGEASEELKKIQSELESLRLDVAMFNAAIGVPPTVDVSEFTHQIEELRAEVAMLSITHHPENVDLSGIQGQLEALMDVVAHSSASGASSISEDSIKQLTDAVSSIKVEQEPDYIVLEELNHIRGEINKIMQKVADSTAEEDSLVILDELGNLRQELVSAKNEPDVGVLSEVLIMREEFANMKDELGKVSDYKKLADKLDALSEAVDNLRERNELDSIADEQTNNAINGIVNEINELKQSLSANSEVLDEIKKVREELALKAGDAQLDDLKLFILSDISQLKEDIAKVSEDAENQKNQQILDEIGKLKEDFASSMEANETALNFMAGLTKLVGGQSADAEILDALNKLKDEVAATKSELSTLEKGVKQKKGDAKFTASIEDLKNELTSIKDMVDSSDDEQ